MFQRTIFRQAQAARSVLAASTSTSAAPLALRRTTRLQSQLPAAMRPFAPQPARRLYSTENNGEKKEATQEGESAEKAEEDPLRQELEQKEKEITDLKVRYMSYCSYISMRCHSIEFLCSQHLGQIPPLRRRVPQPARAHQTRHGRCSQLCHPALRQGPAGEH